MRKPVRFLVALSLLTALLSAPAFGQGRHGPGVDSKIWVRDGFELTVAAETDFTPRFMTLGPDGTVYVADPGKGRITAMIDTDGDGSLDRATPFVTGYKKVHGMQWYDGWLYFTQSQSIHKARDTNGDHEADDIQDIIPEGKLPGGGGHWWRSLLIADLGDGAGARIYTSVGDPGNITDVDASEDKMVQQREKIWSFKLDGTDQKLFISGIRNTEKLVLRPGTKEVWGMDHGSDWHGKPLGEKSKNQPITDRVPGDEMNHYVKGGFYGHPFIVDRGIPRIEFQDREDIIDLADKTTVAQWLSGAHWAANAMTFYTGDQFPKAYKGDAIVTYHGSWNRKIKHGYQATRVLFDHGHPYGELTLVKFLAGPEEPGEQEVLGRPVDSLVDRNGSVLITDDRGKKIYRLSWVGDQGNQDNQKRNDAGPTGGREEQ